MTSLHRVRALLGLTVALTAAMAHAYALPAHGETSPGAHDGHAGGHAPHGAGDHHGGGPAHVHAAVPAEYRNVRVPAAAWTDPRMIARGREIYAARCAACHGAAGDGRGPAAAGLAVKPPDFRDRRMVDAMPGAYWFWRVSEGGRVEPFRSQESAMPAWKHELGVEDRWAVIAYAHTLSGHHGPHVGSEHPELLAPGPGSATGTPPRAPARPPPAHR